MITNCKKWHYLSLKKLFALFCKITSNHNGEFLCLNCFQSYTPKNKLKKHNNVCKKSDYCYI